VEEGGWEMIEATELFNNINNLQSRYRTEALSRPPRHLTGSTRSDSIQRLDAKSLILKTVSNDSTNPVSSLLKGPRSCFAGAAGQDLYGLAPTASSWMKKLGSDELARLSTKCLAPSWSQRGCWASRLDVGLLKNLND